MASTPRPPFAADNRFTRLVHVAQCTSTQELALGDPLPGCAVYWAEHQTRGRGRHGRTWYDEPGRDVAVTLRLDGITLPLPARLPAVVPVAVLNAIERTAPVRARLKWPNDVMVDGRKLAGILIDADGAPPRYAIGVGINVGRTSFPDELMDSATSLALLTGADYDRRQVVAALAESIDAAVTALLAGDVTTLSQTFCRRTDLVGRTVVLGAGGRVERGVVASLDLDAVRFADGRTFQLAVVQDMRPEA